MVGAHTIVTIGVIASKDGGVTSHHVYGFNWVGFMSQFSAAAAYNITCGPRLPPAIWLIAPDAWLAGRYRLPSGDAGLLSGAVSG